MVLHSGDVLRLASTGDLGERNAGVLVFTGDQEQPEYVSWRDVEVIDLDLPHNGL